MRTDPDLTFLGDVPGERIAVVVAHPDDESIAFASVLRRFPGCMVTVVTNGVPEDPAYWKPFGTAGRYEQIRYAELHSALDIVGHTGVRLRMGLQDQKVARDLHRVSDKLSGLLSKHGIEVVLTHAYEGGHPDHDAVAFSVHAARRQLARFGHPLRIFEAPLYHPEERGTVWQRFLPVAGTETIEIPLSSELSDLKKALLEAHASQTAGIVPKVSLTAEWVRAAPAYEFGCPANGGVLSAIYGSAGVSAQRWSSLARTALAAF